MTCVSQHLLYPIDVRVADKNVEKLISERLQKLLTKYQLAPDHLVAKQIKKTIQARILYSRQDKLNNEINLFLKKIGTDGAEKFLNNIEKLILNALEEVEIRAQTNDKYWQCYHRVQHAAEFVMDLKCMLDPRLDTELGKHINTLLRVLTQYAAACHDVEQAHVGEMLNEQASRDYFCESLNKCIDSQFPKLIHHGIVISFKRALNFIAEELIVNGTMLCMSLNRFSSCMPISYLVMCVERDINLDEDEKSEGFDITKYYSLAVRDLSHKTALMGALDTSRSAFRAVVREARIIDLYKDSIVFNPVIKPLLLQLDDPEAFLIRIGQNIRMFPELDRKFYGTMTKAEHGELQQIFKLSAEAQAAGSVRDQKLDQVISDSEIPKVCWRLFEKFINGRGFTGEIDFAGKLKAQKYVDTSRAYIGAGPGSIMGVEKFDGQAWEKHQQQLTLMKQYYLSLPESSKDRFAFATVVFHIAANQPGCHMVLQIQKRHRLTLVTAKVEDSPLAASTEPMSPHSLLSASSFTI